MRTRPHVSPRTFAAATLVVVLWSSAACTDEPPPMSASDTEGRFAGHRSFEEVAPAPKGAAILEPAYPTLGEGLPRCFGVATTYVWEGASVDAVRFYREARFEGRPDGMTRWTGERGEKGANYPAYRQVSVAPGATAGRPPSDVIITVQRPDCDRDGG